MSSLIDSKFHIGNQVWYVDGNVISSGTVIRTTYNYNSKQVYYRLSTEGEVDSSGEVCEKYVFATESEAIKYVDLQAPIKLEKKSTFYIHLDDYIKLGDLVKRPLIVQFIEGYGRFETKEYLNDKYDNNGRRVLNVEGHPFKRGHRHFINEDGKTELISDHPELTQNFLPPSGYNASKPPVVLVSNKLEDYNYAFECVEKLKVPFIIMVPPGHTWVGEDAPEFATQCKSILYTLSLNGWIEDMLDEGHNYPQDEIIKTLSHPSRIIIHLDGADDFNQEYSRIFPLVAERRSQLFMEYVVDLSNRKSLDDLSEPDIFFGGLMREVNLISLPYRIESLFPLYCTLYLIRLLHSDCIDDYFEKTIKLEVQHYRNLAKSFVDYLKGTEDKWVFDFSEPVPQEALDILKDIDND